MARKARNFRHLNGNNVDRVAQGCSLHPTFPHSQPSNRQSLFPPRRRPLCLVFQENRDDQIAL